MERREDLHRHGCSIAKQTILTTHPSGLQTRVSVELANFDALCVHTERTKSRPMWEGSPFLSRRGILGGLSAHGTPVLGRRSDAVNEGRLSQQCTPVMKRREVESPGGSPLLARRYEEELESEGDNSVISGWLKFRDNKRIEMDYQHWIIQLLENIPHKSFPRVLSIPKSWIVVDLKNGKTSVKFPPGDYSATENSYKSGKSPDYNWEMVIVLKLHGSNDYETAHETAQELNRKEMLNQQQQQEPVKIQNTKTNSAIEFNEDKKKSIIEQPEEKKSEKNQEQGENEVIQHQKTPEPEKSSRGDEKIQQPIQEEMRIQYHSENEKKENQQQFNDEMEYEHQSEDEIEDDAMQSQNEMEESQQLSGEEIEENEQHSHGEMEYELEREDEIEDEQESEYKIEDEQQMEDDVEDNEQQNQDEMEENQQQSESEMAQSQQQSEEQFSEEDYLESTNESDSEDTSDTWQPDSDTCESENSKKRTKHTEWGFYQSQKRRKLTNTEEISLKKRSKQCKTKQKIVTPRMFLKIFFAILDSLEGKFDTMGTLLQRLVKDLDILENCTFEFNNLLKELIDIDPNFLDYLESQSNFIVSPPPPVLSQVINKFNESTDEAQNNDDSHKISDSKINLIENTNKTRTSLYEYPDDSDQSMKWTLRFPKMRPELTELMPDSRVYLRRQELKMYIDAAIENRNVNKFAITLLGEIFTEKAILECKLLPKTKVHKVKRLDDYTCHILLLFLKIFCSQNDLNMDKESVIKALKKKMWDMNNRLLVNK